LDRPVLDVAPYLVGAELTFDGVGGTIVEVEAYHHDDPASHGYLGRRTARNGSMFLRGGHAYVYRSYGIHWCLNVVCGEQAGSAVLIRALAPEVGIEVIRGRRRLTDVRLLCAGPGRLCEALAITRAHDGLRLDREPFSLAAPAANPAVVVGPRIGIARGVETPWRFGFAGSPFLSRPFRSSPLEPHVPRGTDHASRR